MMTGVAGGGRDSLMPTNMPTLVEQKKGKFPKVGRIGSIEARFWRKVEKTSTCWLWTASLTNKGYGQIHTAPGKPMIMAHRLSWQIANGVIPNGMHVLHRCDTPRCVRPDHLFLGTQKDNIHDAFAKGRHRCFGRGGVSNA